MACFLQTRSKDRQDILIMQEKRQEKSLIKQNILKYLNLIGVSQYEFYQKTGITRGILGQNNGISEENAARFLACYSDVDANWLLTGNGEMFKSDVPAITKIHKPTKYTETILESQDIALYDIRAAANLKTLLTNKSQNILGKITLPNIPRCDGAMYVTGDSMDPLIKAGDIICYKEIYNINNIIYGEMYVVSIDIEGDEYLNLKYITRSTKGAGWIQLESFNPRHSPNDYELKSVNAIALIKISIRMNTM